MIASRPTSLKKRNPVDFILAVKEKGSPFSFNCKILLLYPVQAVKVGPAL
jgi:hypothetical protein